MTLVLFNLVLALVWVTVSGSFTLPNLIFGFFLGAIALWLVRAETGFKGYGHRTRRIGALVLLFLRELMLSALRVAHIVVTPRPDLKPGIFAYPLTVDRDFEIVLLANMITLTPGTLTVDISKDRKTLYVHALDCSDPDAARRDIAKGFEARIIEAFR